MLDKRSQVSLAMSRAVEPRGRAAVRRPGAKGAGRKVAKSYDHVLHHRDAENDDYDDDDDRSAGNTGYSNRRGTTNSRNGLDHSITSYINSLWITFSFMI